MKRYFECICIAIALGIIAGTILICHSAKMGVEEVLKMAAAAFAVIFFCYKLVTGWLFLNLNIEIAATRQHAGADVDHLSIHIVLGKGSTDSLWLKDIDIKVTKLDQDGRELNATEFHSIKAKGIIKREAKNGMVDWTGREKEYYVLSSNEKTVFGAYTRVNSDAVILLEINVLGTRPFYGLERKPGKKPVQWKASAIVLPNEKNVQEKTSESTSPALPAPASAQNAPCKPS